MSKQIISKSGELVFIGGNRVLFIVYLFIDSTSLGQSDLYKFRLPIVTRLQRKNVPRQISETTSYSRRGVDKITRRSCRKSKLTII